MPMLSAEALSDYSDSLAEYRYLDDPNFLFLDKTLLTNLKRASRRSITFFSTRAWRKGLKDIQIATMRNLKSQPNEQALRCIGRQIAEAAVSITNGKPYDFVCGVPGGSSGKTHNFASLIARMVASELGIAYCAPLTGRMVRRVSSSHPRQSAYFRSRLADAPPEGDFGLLVDDVVASGAHFERCVKTMQTHSKSVVCMAWVSN